MVVTDPAHLRKLQKEYKGALDQFPKKIIVCCGTGCLANGAAKLVESLHDA